MRITKLGILGNSNVNYGDLYADIITTDKFRFTWVTYF